MNDLDIIDHHFIIRETVGYDFMQTVGLMDMPEVTEFLKIVCNYLKMQKINGTY